MVEISMSGSGEGLGWATGRGYSTMFIVVDFRISSKRVKADGVAKCGRQQSWTR